MIYYSLQLQLICSQDTFCIFRHQFRNGVSIFSIHKTNKFGLKLFMRVFPSHPSPAKYFHFPPKLLWHENNVITDCNVIINICFLIGQLHNNLKQTEIAGHYIMNYSFYASSTIVVNTWFDYVNLVKVS